MAVSFIFSKILKNRAETGPSDIDRCQRQVGREENEQEGQGRASPLGQERSGRLRSHHILHLLQQLLVLAHLAHRLVPHIQELVAGRVSRGLTSGLLGTPIDLFPFVNSSNYLLSMGVSAGILALLSTGTN